jgi:hypothetical protein
MTADPVRLLDASDSSESERALLEAGRRSSPVQYDVARGAARFRASLVVLGAAGVGATAATSARAVTGKGLVLGGVATKAILAVVLPAVAIGVSVGVYHYVGGRNEHAAVRTAATVSEAAKPSNGASSPVALPSAASAQPAADERPVEGAPTKEDAPGAVELRGPETGATHARGHHRHARGVDGRIPNVRVVLADDDGDESDVEESGSAGPSSGAESSGSAALGMPASSANAAPAVVEPLAAKPAAPAPSVAAVVRPPPATAPVRAPSAASSPAEQPVLQPSPPRTAADETRAIAHARSLLASNPSDALAALEQIRKDFPAGYFGEERRALTIFALLRTGNRAAAVERAKAFIRSYPNGPFTDKIRSTLGLSP